MEQDEIEVKRLLDLLRTLLRLLDCSLREVERRLDLSPSMLQRFFQGKVEARLVMVLGVARAAGFQYAEFFAMAYPPGSDGEAPETARRANAALAAFQSAGRRRRRSDAGAPVVPDGTHDADRRRRKRARAPRNSPGSTKGTER